jgi:hypothetical protein
MREHHLCSNDSGEWKEKSNCEFPFHNQQHPSILSICIEQIFCIKKNCWHISIWYFINFLVPVCLILNITTFETEGPSCLWSYGSLIYNYYLRNHCLSPLEFELSSWPQFFFTYLPESQNFFSFLSIPTNSFIIIFTCRNPILLVLGIWQVGNNLQFPFQIYKLTIV